MIRFSAILAVVVTAVGLLVAGAVSGSLLVVYLAIGVAALALLMLIGGVLIWRDEIFGEQAVGGQARAAADQPAAVQEDIEQPADAQPEVAQPAAAEVPKSDGARGRVPVPDPADARSDRPASDRPAEDASPAAPVWPRRTAPWEEPASPARKEAAAWPRPAADAGAGEKDSPARLSRPDRRRAEPEPVKAASAQTDSAKAEPSKTQPVKAEPVKTQPVKAEPVKADSAQAPPAKAEPAKSEPAKAEPVKAETVRSETVKSETVRSSAKPGPLDIPAAQAAGKAASAPVASEPKPKAGQPPAPARETLTSAAASTRNRSGQDAPPKPAGADGPPSVDELLRRAGRDSSRASATGSSLPPRPFRLADPPAPAPASPSGRPPEPESPPADKSPASASKPETPAKPDPAAKAETSSRPRVDEERPQPKDAEAGTPARPQSARPAPATPAAPVPAAPVATAAPVAAAPGATGEAETGQPGAAESGPAGASGSAGLDLQVTVVPGIARYHLADCILIRFLGADDLEVMTRQAAEDAHCVPCKACRPEK